MMTKPNDHDKDTCVFFQLCFSIRGMITMRLEKGKQKEKKMKEKSLYADYV